MKNTKTKTAVYYGIRVAQRVSLLVLGLVTILHWVILVVVAGNLSFIGETKLEFEDSEVVNDTIRRAIDTQSITVVKWAVIAAAVTALLMLLPRVRRHEKRLVVDSLIVIVFCFLSVVFSQPLLRAYMTRLAG